MAQTQNGVLKRDDNDSPVMGGTSSTDNATIINAAFDPVTRRLLVDTSGATFIDNEIVAGSATTFTLAGTPTSGSQHVYARGQRLTPGAGNDYTISGAIITTALSWSAGDILADYRS